MPTYEYNCGRCEKNFEVFQSMSDEPLRSCPDCGSEIRRLVGGGLGIIFKGSGFYVTDNKKGKSGEKTAAHGSSDGTAAAGAGSASASGSASGSGPTGTGSTSSK